MVSQLLLAGAATLALAQGDRTASVSQSFDGATALEIEDFVGTVRIREGRQFTVRLAGADSGGPIDLVRDGDTVRVDGPDGMVKRLYRRGSPWQKRWGSWNSGEAQTQFAGFLEDYPVLEVTLPEGSDLSIDEAAMILDVALDVGTLDTDSLYEVYATLGNADNARIGIGGMGKFQLGNVAGDLDIGIGGSGDVTAGEAGRAEIAIGGSGDVSLGDVRGDLDLQVGGSGDVRAGDVGSADVQIAGSGSLAARNVGNGLRVAVAGSGDVDVSRMAGPLDVSINGSGDVEIGGGESSTTRIRISGSGDVEFDGVATDPRVSVYGSGEVAIADYRGDVNVSGDRDDVRIGDLRFDDRRR